MPSRTRARARYVAGLPSFLRASPSPERCRRTVGDQYAIRSEALLRIFEAAVYANPASPYRRLLEHAGIELGDVAAMLGGSGVEATMTKLHDAGVRLSIDEFKGRVPIRRPGLELECAPADFDNPLLRRHYEAATSGARSATRIAIDLDLLAHEAAYLSLCLDGFDLREMPFAVWRPVLPGLAGMKGLLRRAHLGLDTAAWFSQYRHGLRPSAAKFKAMTAATVAMAAATGPRIPRPRHVPLERAAEVSGWLAGQRRRGTPAHLDTNWSSAVRVCAAARAAGDDLEGTFFRVGGEPATPARAAAIEASGGTFAAHYSMGEVGWIGVACPEREAIDEVHLLADKLAIVQPGEGAIRPLVLTTLLPSSPKLLLNVDVGDHAEARERSCGCPVGSLGMRTTLRSIASHEKLTVEGMNFVGSDIAWLLEEALPARFGGAVGDYQLTEDRTEALGRVGVVVPAAATATDSEVTAATLELLGELGDGQRLMAEQWRQAGALFVTRGEPYVRGNKIQHVHRIRDAAQR